MAYDVFISHSSKDKLTADAICHALEQNGIRCWIAPRDVRPGETYGAEIIGAIKESSVFLLVFSKNSNASEDVVNEIQNAFKRSKMIIPYRLDDAEMSDEMEYFLSRKHWIDAYPNDTVFEDLVSAVKTLIGMPVDADDGKTGDKKEGDSSNRKEEQKKSIKPHKPPGFLKWGIPVAAVLVVTIIALVVINPFKANETLDGNSNANGAGTQTSKSDNPVQLENGVYRPIVLAGDDVLFAPRGTATIFLKDGTQHITYPGSFPLVETVGEEYSVEFPGESTRDFYFEEAKVVRFAQIDEKIYEITGELSSGDEILKYTSDAGRTVPFNFRVYTNENRVVSVPYTHIDRIEIDNTVTPDFDTSRMATITLRNGTSYKTPISAIEFDGVKTVGYVPQSDYGDGLPVRAADGVATVPFSAMRKVVFTPELIDFDSLGESSYPCPGTITYKDGTEKAVDFAIGGYYIQSLSFFCPYRYSLDLRNNNSANIGGPYMNQNTISEVLSIEFDT